LEEFGRTQFEFLISLRSKDFFLVLFLRKGRLEQSYQQARALTCFLVRLKDVFSFRELG
jgi:hypothetical protein